MTSLDDLYDKVDKLETTLQDFSANLEEYFPEHIWLGKKPGNIVCIYRTGEIRYYPWEEVAFSREPDPHDPEAIPRYLAWADLLEQKAAELRALCTPRSTNN